VRAIDVRCSTQLTAAEIQAFFQFVIQRSVPAPADNLTMIEAALLVAADLLKGYGFGIAPTLLILGRLKCALDAETLGVWVLNIVDRRCVGWSGPKENVMVDMTTGEDVKASFRFLESIAYELHELIERRVALARGERPSLWEKAHAGGQASCGAAPGGGDGLGRPPVICDHPGPPLS
jgi:hypothetical protein